MCSVPALRRSELVGRDAELEEMISRLGLRTPGADHRGGRAVLLAGDAGVGKTRLLTELRDVAVAEGWQVLAGHCLDLADGSLPYLPFSEILGRVLMERPDVAASVTERHPTLARLQPGRRLHTTDDVHDVQSLDRGNMFAGVFDLLETLAEAGPLLVLVEDAHWSGQSTRDMLSFLFSRPFSGRVALVVSYRSDDLHRRHPLRAQVAEWARLRDVVRLQLEPLSIDDSRRLVYSLTRDSLLLEAEVAEIVELADGNAFFVEELVGARWATHGQIPAELADVLLVRLDGLDDLARQVVRVASVAGRHVSHELLAAVTGLAPDLLEGALRTAVDAHVLTSTPNATYAFRHALLGEAVYDDLLPGERVRLHAAFVAAWDSDAGGATSAELALHARQAGDMGTALRASVASGNEAMAVGGPDEAATQFLTALEILASMPAAPDDLDVPGLVSRCAEALVASGRVARAIQVLRAHLASLPADASGEERGRLLTSIAAALLLTDTTEDPEKVAGEAVGLLRDGSPRLLARALAVHAQSLGRGNGERARTVALEALALAERHSLTAVALEIVTTLTALDQGREPDQLRAAWLASAQKARDAGVVDAELRALYFLARLHHDRGELEEAHDIYARIVARGEGAGMVWAPYPADARSMQALVLIQRGRPDEAWRLLDVTGLAPPLVYEWLYFALQMLISTMRGDPMKDAFTTLRSYWDRDGLIALIAGTAEILDAEQNGDPAAAQETYDVLVATIRPLWHEWFQARLRLASTIIGIHASVAVRSSASDRETAALDVAELYEDGERVIGFCAELDVVPGPEYDAWVARRVAEHLRWRWLAQLDPPSAEELTSVWQRAEELFVVLGHVYELARVRARYAAVLRAVGEHPQARAMADLARTAAHEIGAAPLLAELTALGSAPAPRVSGPRALTRREREILGLVAEGRSNGDIGKQLFISTKTVSVHVSNILGKLDAASRTEAAAIGRRRGLL